MIVSLNELQGTVLKAARGAGLAWGLAEETAAAAIWLARADMLLLEPLVARLEATRTTSLSVNDQSIQPTTPGTALCPIQTGAWIADQGSTNQRFEVREVLAPLWLSAVVARALQRECQLVVEWQDVQLALSWAGPLGRATGCPSKVSAKAASSVSLIVRHCAEARVSPAHLTTGVFVRDADWQALQAFEQRTYVPASERSRTAGAGAGLLDDD